MSVGALVAFANAQARRRAGDHCGARGASVPGSVAVSVAAMLLLGACQSIGRSPGCSIEGPPDRVPGSAGKLRMGMSLQDVERHLGPADYSPAAGIYYFSTGGDCPLGDEGHQASCGVVAEFSAGSIASPYGRLSSCWWGAIAE